MARTNNESFSVATSRRRLPSVARIGGTVAIGCAALALFGCSTMSTINSRPTGATVFLNGTQVGQTPVKVDLNDGFLPSAKYTARLELDGYETKTVPLGQDYNFVWLFLDVCLCGTLPGLIPAAFNGQNHRPSYSFDLEPLGGGYGGVAAGPGAGPAPAVTPSHSPPPSRPSGPKVTSAAGTAPAHLNGTRIAVLPAQLDASAKGQVPELFNDYMMAAVQEAGNFEVIGQDDINTLIGFEEQRDLLDCSDTSCIADIGGALGVDRIMGVKVARLGNDWVITAKIINIKAARVEARVNDIIGGQVKDLLQAVPGVVANVFSKL